MMGRNHLILGLSTYAIGHGLGWITATPFGFAACALGSLLPDIDHEKSLIGRRIAPLAMIINQLSPHRGATHSLGFLLLIFILTHLSGVPLDIVIGLNLGILSHLIGDCFFGYRGCPLFWPSKNKIIFPVHAPTGSIAELIFTWVIGLSSLGFWLQNAPGWHGVLGSLVGS